MKIFIINGNAGCGKTTFGEYAAKILKGKKIPFLHDSSIKPVKDFVQENGWEGKKWDGVTKDDYWRRALYECKCWMIENDKNIFDKYALEKIHEISDSSSEGILFFDIREPENISQLVEYVKENDPKVKVFSLFVERNSDFKFNNYADQNQSNYKYDIFLDNNGDLDNLYKNTERFVGEYIISGSKTA